MDCELFMWPLFRELFEVHRRLPLWLLLVYYITTVQLFEVICIGWSS